MKTIIDLQKLLAIATDNLFTLVVFSGIPHLFTLKS